ncbi:helix-turn-helix domain-containing protein [Spirillospora sp. NPDC048911]|uniref:GbsR/MarR family transcriptional regulator n=1 Tax=Spirillospora sp. NPDC048911 TaxID=3364527 RepID=UPI003717FF50
MPGGRLTHQDRRRIATGLADGLGYAEIARQLDRPTSTISREVARNGGPELYRADHAHLATGRRARRDAPAAPPTVPTDEYGRDIAKVRDFVERFASVMVEAGLPKMAARVLACLVTTDAGALSAAELVQRLRVSPASVSKAIAYLEALDVVRREHGRRGRQRYLIDDDVWLQTWLTRARTHGVWADTAEEGTTLFGADTPAGARLHAMSHFFSKLSADMASAPTEDSLKDAVTVFAALLHAGRPLTSDQLATALDWPAARTTTALTDAERLAAVTDPLMVHRPTPTTYTVAAAPDALTPTQRQALEDLARGGAG